MAIDGIFYVHILVSDLARAKRFYGETLGWKLETDESHVAGFRFGTGYLVAEADGRAEVTRRHGGGMHVSVRVGDLDAQHARLTANGVDVSPIHSRPWGERNFRLVDPDGYVWEYGQPVE